MAYVLRGRGMLSAAETVLDDVYIGILTHGCSERTYLAFMLEAGRILLGQNRPVRAFSSYLLPCLRRAHARGFLHIESVAYQQSHDALIAIHQEALDSDESTWTRKLGQIIKDDRAYRKRMADYRERMAERTAPGENDPLYSYAIVDAERTIGRFHTVAGIEAVKHDFESARRKATGR